MNATKKSANIKPIDACKDSFKKAAKLPEPRITCIKDKMILMIFIFPPKYNKHECYMVY